MNINRKALLLFIPALVFSAKGETLDEMKTEYNEIIEEQEYTMTMLEENYSVQDEIKAEIAELDSRLSEAQVDIDRIDMEMAELLLKINEAQEEYDKAKEKSEAQYEKTAERLRFIYENEDNYFEYLSKCGDAEKYSFYKQYILDIIEYDTELLEQLKETELYMQEKLDEIKKSEEAKAVL